MEEELYRVPLSEGVDWSHVLCFRLAKHLSPSVPSLEDCLNSLFSHHRQPGLENPLQTQFICIKKKRSAHMCLCVRVKPHLILPFGPDF